MGYELETVRVRLVKGIPLYSERRLEDTEAVVDLMAEELSGYDRETLCVLNMNAKNQVLNMNLASMGTLDASLANPREIFKSAILSNASAIILLHNHPSGIVEPSQADLDVTERMKESGKILGIRLLDHLVIGGGTGEVYSIIQECKVRGAAPGQTKAVQGADMHAAYVADTAGKKTAAEKKRQAKKQSGPKL